MSSLLVAEKRDLSACTPRERRFVQIVGEGESDLRAAYLEAGYADNRSSMKNARQKYRELRLLIGRHARAHIKSEVQGIRGYKIVSELAEEAQSEAVKLQAAKEMMTKAGFDEAKEVTINHKKDMSGKELEDRIQELVAELGADAKVIEGVATVVDEPRQ